MFFNLFRLNSSKFDGDFETKLITLSCSEAPEGFVRWSLRMLADKMVELEYIDSVSHETIRCVFFKRIASGGLYG